MTFRCSSGHEIDQQELPEPGTVECESCARWIKFVANAPLTPTPPLIVGRTPLRVDAGLRNSAIYSHNGHECLVWDFYGDGKLSLECDCGLAPIELAADLGISRDRLSDDELDISARMLAERTLETNPDDLNAKAVLHALGPT